MDGLNMLKETSGNPSSDPKVFPAKILIMADKDEDGEATFQDCQSEPSETQRIGGFTMAKPWPKPWVWFSSFFSMEKWFIP